MGSFGERLRREREMRGVTLDEISNSTKIARRHLESLEADNFDELPGGVFNRGFVRAYARYLGIDEDQAVADYVAVADQAAPPQAFPVDLPDELEPKLNPRRSSLPLVLAVLALVAVLAIFWARSKRQPEITQSPSNSGTATPAPIQKSAAVTAKSESRPAPAAEQTPSSVPSRSPQVTASPETSVPEPGTIVRPAPPASSAPGQTFDVVVQVTGDSWISVTADGKAVAPGRIMKAGEQQSVRAGRKIVLITGNAGGVEISFNGKPLGPIGKAGSVRTLTFTPAGLVQ